MNKQRKIVEIWKLVRAKHYALLIGGSEEEIGWAIEALRNADNLAKSKPAIKGKEPTHKSNKGKEGEDER